jgi:hypothetical protein
LNPLHVFSVDTVENWAGIVETIEKKHAFEAKVFILFQLKLLNRDKSGST